jgi:hypothetical protein
MTDPIKMADIYVKLLSGDLYRININVNEGIEGLERSLVSLNRKIFHYGNLIFFREIRDTYEKYTEKDNYDWVYDLVDGDVITVFTNDFL